MKRSWLKRILGLHGTLFLLFVYAPIVMVVVLSFNANPINMMIWSGFTFDWYWSIFGYPTKLNEQTLYVESTDQLLSAVKNSLSLSCFMFRAVVLDHFVRLKHVRTNLIAPACVDIFTFQRSKFSFLLATFHIK